MMTRMWWVGACGLALVACGPPPVTDACKGRLVGDLVVTEIMLDPEGTDTGAEYFEIYNTLGSDLDLKGMVIFTRDTDGTGAKSHIIKAGTVKAQSYFTFGDIRAGVLPKWIGYTYGDALGSFPNTKGVVGIKCGTTTFDEFTWTKAARANRSRMLDPTAPKTSMANDDESKWCDTQAGTVYVGNSAGTPGAENVACMPEATIGTCVENGTTRAIRFPGTGDLIITELMPNPKVALSTTGEWFEVLATKSVDLNDLTIANPTSDTDVRSSACIPVSPGEYVLFARSGDSFINGNLPTPKLTYSLSLTDTMSRLFLRRGDAGIDEAAYLAAANGISWQLDDAQLNDVANNDPLNFCLSSRQWDAGVDAGVRDLGSPGARNEICPGRFDGGSPDGGGPDGGSPDAGDPNSCFDVGAGAFRPIVKATTGDFVVTEYMADPAVVTDALGEWFEVLVKSAADFNGLMLSGTTGLTTLSSANCLRYDAGTLVLFASNADTAANGGIGPLLSTVSFGLTNGTGSIRLFTDAGMVDQVMWTTSVTSGRSKQLDINKQDSVQNDMQTNFCDSDAGILLADGGAGDKGTPGIANRTCP